MRRALLIALAASALCGCDAVTSKTQLFGPQDAAQQQLKPGLWVVTNGDCRFDETLLADAWPSKCALAVQVRKADVLIYERESDKSSHWSQAWYLLAGGDPPIMQTYTPDGGGEYEFYAVSPDRIEPDGLIVAAHVRQISCGPTPPASPSPASTPAPGSAPAPAADSSQRDAPLYPGLIATGRTGCTPKGVEGLREAARAGANDGLMPAHWVRESWR